MVEKGINDNCDNNNTYIITQTQCELFHGVLKRKEGHKRKRDLVGHKHQVSYQIMEMGVVEYEI